MKHLYGTLFLLLVTFSLAFAQTEPPSDLEGTELQTWLKDNWYTGKFSDQGYNGARTAMYGTIDVRQDGRVYCVYSGFSQEAESTTFLDPINAEHTVPQSIGAGESPMRSDIIHLFPTHGTVNSARGNNPFQDIVDAQANTWYGSDQSGLISTSSMPESDIDAYSEVESGGFEPREDHKGDVARAVFYFFTVYNSATITQVAEIDLLYQWHQEDPVDDWERTRNDRIETAQGNRNPYVDYPDLVCKAWSSNCATSGGGGGSFSDVALIISGVFDGPLSGGTPKVVELYAVSDISDLSSYGISAATNGSGATGAPNFTFSGTISAGDYLYITTDAERFTEFFDTTPDFVDNVVSVNGDDAIELFENDGQWEVIDIFGEVAVDGSGQPWEYLDGWAYRKNDTGADGDSFAIANWTFSGINVMDGETTNITSAAPFPIGTFTKASVCTPPVTQATNLAVSETADNSISLTWSRGNGDEVLLVARTSGMDAAHPSSGDTYTADAEFGSGAEIGVGNFVVYAGSAAETTVTGLVQGTSYDFSAYEFTGTSACYLVESPAAVSASTTTSNDQDSDIRASEQPVAAANVSATANVSDESVTVFKFNMVDLGSSDASNTEVSRVVIESGPDNDVNWSDILGGAVLIDGEASSAVSLIEDSKLTFDLENLISISDGNTKELALAVWLDTAVVDNSTLQFQIPETHGFSAVGTGSLIRSTLTTAVVSASHTITVEASELALDVDASARLGKGFSARVRAIDENGNIDDADRQVSLSLVSGGTLSSVTGLSDIAMAVGEYTWSDLTINTVGTYQLSITDGVLSSTSGDFSVVELTKGLFFSEYIEGSSNNKALELYNASGSDLDLSQFSIERLNNGATTNPFVLVLSDVQATLGAGEVMVISNPGADEAIQAVTDITSEITFYNGDDALALKQGEDIIDMFGKIGEDPGSNWTVGATGATSEYTLVRKPTVFGGNPDPLASFGTTDDDSEWIVLAQNDFSNIGMHTIEDQSCTPPTEAATNFTSSAITESQATLQWTRGNGSQIIVIGRESAPVDMQITEGESFAGNLSFGAGDEIGEGNFVIYVGDGQEAIVTGLAQGATYHFAAIEFGADPFCYATEIAVVTNFTTLTPNDIDSEITIPVEQVVATSISSLLTSEEEAIPVFKFSVTDLATTDNLSTFLTAIVVAPDANNVAVWSETIAGAKLTTGEVEITLSSVDAESLIFTPETPIEVPSGSSRDFSLAIWLQTTVTDEDTLVFSIPAQHQFVADPKGSLLNTSLGEAVISATHSVDVSATSLDLTYPASVNLASTFTMGVTAIDANSNVDISSGMVDISVMTGSGTLTSAVGLTSQSLDSGYFEWSDLRYSTVEDVVLQVSMGDLAASAEISFFEISEGLLFSEYVEGSAFNKAVEIYNASDQSINLSQYMISRYQNGSPTPTDEFSLAEIQPALESGGVLVIAHPSADQSVLDLADATDNIVDFNGDDAMALLGDDEVIDLIGDIGVDPGSSWSVASSGSTQNHTLVRKPAISAGNATGLGSFGVDDETSEWIVLDQDDFTNLGIRDVGTGGGDNPEFSVDIANFSGDFGEVLVGASSVIQSIVLTGTDLTNSVSVTAPAGYGMSISDENFQSTLTLTPSGGSINQTISVMFSPEEAGTFTGNISFVSADFEQENIAVSGSALLPAPKLSSDTQGFSGAFGETETGIVSEAQSFTLFGENLTSDVIVTIPAGFEVSETSDFTVAFTEELTLQPVDGSLQLILNVRFAPDEDGDFSADLVIASADADVLEIPLSGFAFTPMQLSLDEANFRIYPNPVTDFLTIELGSNSDLSVRIIGLDGAVLSTQLRSGERIDMSAYQSGIYVLEVKTSGKLYFKKLFIR